METDVEECHQCNLCVRVICVLASAEENIYTLTRARIKHQTTTACWLTDKDCALHNVLLTELIANRCGACWLLLPTLASVVSLARVLSHGQREADSWVVERVWWNKGRDGQSVCRWVYCTEVTVMTSPVSVSVRCVCEATRGWHYQTYIEVYHIYRYL